MNIDYQYYPYETGYGWTCEKCGTFVPGALSHSCPTYTYNIGGLWPPPDYETKELLRRIANLLEKLIEKG